jgi:DNA-binding XRE family transcriptional regulator
MLLNEGLPVKRYTRRVKVLPGGGVATTLPGALCESLASLLAPTAQEARSMLLEIRERHSLSRPLLASFMGTSRHTIRCWEKGLREPSGPSKRLIQMVHKRLVSEVTGDCFIL